MVGFCLRGFGTGSCVVVVVAVLQVGYYLLVVLRTVRSYYSTTRESIISTGLVATFPKGTKRTPVDRKITRAATESECLAHDRRLFPRQTQKTIVASQYSTSLRQNYYYGLRLKKACTTN